MKHVVWQSKVSSLVTFFYIDAPKITKRKETKKEFIGYRSRKRNVKLSRSQ